MYGVHTIGQHFFESGKIHGVAVAVKEEDVVEVNLANGLLNILVPYLQAGVLWICRLVHRVVAGDLHFLSVQASEKESRKRTHAFPA